MLGIKWLDEGEGHNTVDLIPQQWLAVEADWTPTRHEVLGSDGYSNGRVNCAVRVQGAIVDIDYEGRFAETNEARGFIIGMTRLKFTSAARQGHPKVWWRPKGSQVFERCTVDFVAQPTADGPFESQMSTLDDLRPRSKRLVFDLVAETGFDTSDWESSYRGTRSHKTNPKYCYEWAFLQPQKLIVLSLWYSDLLNEGGRILLRANFREDATARRQQGAKRQWADRAQKLDDALSAAVRTNLAVRVILVAGKMRQKHALDGPASQVQFRELDPEPWTITAYDFATGACELTRGIAASHYVDQFDLREEDLEHPERKETMSAEYVRDPAVRRRVLARSRGRCELCGEPGFRMEGGNLYLETHHIIPLALGGLDKDDNVVALCANDHRRAHYSAEKFHILEKLKEVRRAERIP
ncbi:HNH endonuclease signature motif containing protein [Sphingobium sp. B11D3A]|uniref:HNH endonuclease n=1 Tax=Sphingobium sp. B11D3A TaxID=2940574 RepID=UPI0022248EC8|nr:HNH endonuclease signature motif containing protein [Sphingobium sp. B11D3A]MCW2391956.1 hypothetical protein [Sphingobium sp. B11D3A]